MDRVAERAGTNKNAIYRRWPSRAALAVAAYRQMAAGDLPLPDTGTLRDDALELLRRANRAWSSPVGTVQRSLLAGVAHDPELLALIQERSNDAGSAVWLTILGRAVARGEARPEALHPRALLREKAGGCAALHRTVIYSCRRLAPATNESSCRGTEGYDRSPEIRAFAARFSRSSLDYGRAPR